MPNTVLGKVSVVPRGDYNASTTYYALDIVGYNGGSYLAMKEVTGVTPSNDQVNWMQLSGPGLPGVDGVTFTPSVSEAGVISWTNDGEEENPDPVDIMGPPGAAAGFGTVTATADNTSSETPSVDVQSSGPDTARNFTFAFSGLKGKPGDTPDIKIGTVNTLEPGQDATADITGTTPNLTLSLGIPKGQPGTSVSRIERTSGTGAPGTTDTYTMYDSDDEAIGTFTVYNGSNGTGSGDFMANGTVPMTGELQMGGNKVTGMAAPTADTDGATKGYVDEAVAGVEVTTDATPTQGSTNPVQSGGVYTALQGVEDNIPTKVSDLTNDSGYLTAESDPTVPAWAKAASKPTYTAAEVGAIPSTQKGASGGVAELDSSGKVPTAQLPSYVDDVLEYDSLSAFPATGEDGKIYVAEDTNLTYRWSGTQYVEISPSLALGETSSTAYRGDRGKTAYDHSQTTGNPHGTTAEEVGAMPAVSGGTTGQVLTKTASGQAWGNLTASDVSAVPTTRTVNGKPLSADITLSASDVGAASTEDLEGTEDVIVAYFNVFSPKLRTATLTTAGWSSNSQTVTVTGVLADSSKQAVRISPADKDSADAWAEAGVWCTGQAADSLTFTCDSTPTAAINLNIELQGV